MIKIFFHVHCTVQIYIYDILKTMYQNAAYKFSGDQNFGTGMRS
jgi:hypothetical protein